MKVDAQRGISGMWGDINAWLAAGAAVIGASVSALGLIVAGYLKSKADVAQAEADVAQADSNTSVGMTQAQVKILEDTLNHLVNQRKIISRQDEEIRTIRDQQVQERKECDARISRLEKEYSAIIKELNERIAALEFREQKHERREQEHGWTDGDQPA